MTDREWCDKFIVLLPRCLKTISRIEDILETGTTYRSEYLVARDAVINELGEHILDLRSVKK